jgi:hypothetical protein
MKLEVNLRIQINKIVLIKLIELVKPLLYSIIYRLLFPLFLIFLGLNSYLVPVLKLDLYL